MSTKKKLIDLDETTIEKLKLLAKDNIGKKTLKPYIENVLINHADNFIPDIEAYKKNLQNKNKNDYPRIDT